MNGEGPTEYEVWRDALSMAAQNVFPVDDESDLINPFGAGSRYEQIRRDAEWFWEQLQDVPVLKGVDGTDTDDEPDYCTEPDCKLTSPHPAIHN